MMYIVLSLLEQLMQNPMEWRQQAGNIRLLPYSCLQYSFYMTTSLHFMFRRCHTFTFALRHILLLIFFVILYYLPHIILCQLFLLLSDIATQLFGIIPKQYLLLAVIEYDVSSSNINCIYNIFGTIASSLVGDKPKPIIRHLLYFLILFVPITLLLYQSILLR